MSGSDKHAPTQIDGPLPGQAVEVFRLEHGGALPGELQPCPFCGEDDASYGKEPKGHFVRCLNCYSRSPITALQEGARTVWNTRSAPVSAASSSDGAKQWEWPCDTVGKLINNLQTLPPEMPFYTSYFVEIGGVNIAKTTYPSLSRETVFEGRVQKYDREQQSLVLWATAFPSERSNVLEEAAQVCEQMRPVNAGSHVLQVQRDTLDNAARLVRALRYSEQPTSAAAGSTKAAKGEDSHREGLATASHASSSDAQDAARYRWLRSSKWYVQVMSDLMDRFPKFCVIGTELDAAIDGAMKTPIAASAKGTLDD